MMQDRFFACLQGKTLRFTLLDFWTSQFVFRFGSDFQVLSSQFEIGSVE